MRRRAGPRAAPAAAQAAVVSGVDVALGPARRPARALAFGGGASRCRRRVAARKRAAIGCFASQLQDRGHAGPVLPAGIVAHFARDVEVLFR